MKTYLYLAHSISDEVIYVGITNNFDQRIVAHASEKSWWEEVDYVVVKTYESREDAEAAERHKISLHYPKYNQLLGVNTKPAQRLNKRRIPKTYSKLPPEEVSYLRTLNSDETYRRCAELQQAGWSVASMLEGAQVAPTLPQLQIALKYIKPEKTGHPVPIPPQSRAEYLREYKDKFEKDNYLSEQEKALLKEYAAKSKKYRPQYGPNHPLYQAVEEYKELITELRNRGVLFSTMAKVVGVNESNIRRRYIKMDLE